MGGSGGWPGHGDDVAGRVSIALELGEFWNEVPSIELVVEEFPDVPLRPSYWRRRRLERGYNRGGDRRNPHSGSGAGERGTGMTKALTDKTPMARETRATLENMIGSVVGKDITRPGVWEVG